MSSAPPPLSLTHEQAKRLHVSLQAYRCSVLASFQPSTDRNTLLRVLQTLQGKLLVVMDQPTARSPLLLTAEEMTALKTCLTALLYFYAHQPASTERSAALANLAALKVLLKVC